MQSNGINHLIQSRILTERLCLRRNPTEYQAYIETFRESLIDANPHQIESVVFALEKLENGGCILADEVGLGKTIEAGLVISQYRARRRFNILIIVPTSLAGQWNSELRKLFQVPSRIITSKSKKELGKKEPTHHLFREDGVYILGREFASRLQKERILSQRYWDLIIVDEAHEIFSNIYRRFSSRTGEYAEKSKDCVTAANLFPLFKKTPILLLTATPIQNNILELWGLSAYILPERNKSHLGQFNHFKELFIQNGEVNGEKMSDLKDRIQNFIIRNLRAKAQTFMKYKFTDRNCQTLNFNMNEGEKALYEDISRYLDRDDIYAYSTNGIIDLLNERVAGIRNLLKMNYRRALGSSFSALKLSLNGIVDRLETMKAGAAEVDLISAVASDDPENDEEDCLFAGIAEPEGGGAPHVEEGMQPVVRDQGHNLRAAAYPAPRVDEGAQAVDAAAIESEILEVKGFIERAERIEKTGKDEILIHALKTVFSNPDRFYQKAVIFTTYRATQRHLKKILEESGFADEVILFSGSGRREEEEKMEIDNASAIWEEEVGHTIPFAERPSGDILERTALVHYFKTRKKVLISTEAGAKGLNLQFCNVIINYDLPWNPQRIEQRIGRCHRYGQERDVLVINCINADNETEQRIYDILYHKFSLFKTILGTGDDVLGTLSKAIHFESRINDILNRFKTRQERLIWLEQLEREIDEATKKLKDEKLVKTRKLLDELDPHVTLKLRDIKEKLPESFSRYDEDMLNLIKSYAQYRNVPFQVLDQREEQIFIAFDSHRLYIGKRDEDTIRDYQHISLKHDLMRGIMDEILQESARINSSIYFDYTNSPLKSNILKPFVNCVGRWDFYKVSYAGLEDEDMLYDIVAIRDGNEWRQLNPDEIHALKNLNFHGDHADSHTDGNPSMEGYLNSLVSQDTRRIQQYQQPRIDRKRQNLEVELRDMEDYLKKKEGEIKEKLDEVDKRIAVTYDREEGQRLIKMKGNLQRDLGKTRTDLLEFQNDFFNLKNEEELKLIEKRFIETRAERIFTLPFRIR